MRASRAERRRRGSPRPWAILVHCAQHCATGKADLRDMAAYAKANDMNFSVVLMPAGIAYGDDGYALADMYARIGAFLRQQGIPYVDPTGEFAEHPERYFDHTDHFYPAGNERMAQIMGDLIRDLDPGDDSTAQNAKSVRDGKRPEPS